MRELIHFTGEWCKPCQAMAPMIEKFLLENSDIIYTKIDVDDAGAQKLIQDEQVLSIPTFVGFVDHENVGKHTGIATLEELSSIFIKLSE